MQMHSLNLWALGPNRLNELDSKFVHTEKMCTRSMFGGRAAAKSGQAFG